MEQGSNYVYSSHPGQPLLPRPPEIVTHSGRHAGYNGSGITTTAQHPLQGNYRSCTECGRRKVRCDRYYPCANCVKANSDCIFPGSRRTPGRQRKPARGRNEELLKSLHRLERRLLSRKSPEWTPGPLTDHDPPDEEEEMPTPSEKSGGGRNSTLGPSTPIILCDEVTNKREERARLVLDHHRSRYISNNFWASMSREVEEMRDILDGSSSEQENDDGDRGQEGDTHSSPIFQSSPELFMFSPIATSRDLQSLYPSPADLLTIFDVFQENVDPVVRIFHRPTLRSTILQAHSHLDGSLGRHTELVLFSVCYAALTSLNETDCQRLFGKDAGVLVPRYRYAVEQALARARFLDSQNLVVLASLVLFLVCVRRHDNSRFVSSVLGVVIRNAQGMGLHRDGTKFQLSPYETEMRRRVWWHICVLDIRASEDHGCDPSIYDQNHDTRFPLNINDEDISPEDTIAPTERSATSDMTFCLLRFEVAVALRRLNYPAPIGSGQTELSTAQKRNMVEATERHFQERYIDRCDITKPFDSVSAAWARLMLCKMWLAVTNPLQSQDDGEDGTGRHGIAAVTLDLRRLVFEKSVEVLELSDLLETGHRAARWRWLFLTHVQWHALVFVLAYLCAQPTDNLVHRAWLVVNRAFERWPSGTGAKKGMLWRPIIRLADRARQIHASKRTGSRGEVGGFELNHQYRPADDAAASLSEGVRLPNAPAATSNPARSMHEHDMANVTPVSRTDTSMSFTDGSVRRHEAGYQGQQLNASICLSGSTSLNNVLDTSISQSDVPKPPLGGGPDDLNPDSLHVDWTNILYEVQMGFQVDEDMTSIDPFLGYDRSLWNSL